MKIAIYACSAVLLLAFTPVLSQAQSTNPNLASLLNKASRINHEEENMASELKNKAGDNQALATLATTINEDHKANESAVKSLANQKNINLNSNQQNRTAQNELSNLKGAQFNRKFLTMEIRDHQKALAMFRQAKSQFSNDPDVRVYIDQTIPVLEAHLKMAENLHRDDQMLGSRENPANNGGNNNNNNNNVSSRNTY
jgi:putative membrane protein